MSPGRTDGRLGAGKLLSLLQKLAFYDDSGAAIASFRSDDSSLPAAKRPSVRPGLNRFVWDLKYPGPETLDASLAPPRNKPLAERADP